MVDVVACLVSIDIVMVEIPIEMGLAFLFEPQAELSLCFLHHVEAHEEIGIILELDILVGSHLAIEGAFVSQSLTFQ